MSKAPSTKSTPKASAIRPSPLMNGQDRPSPGRESVAAPKPKRVRTGCLTCRERHLKCDEASPNCQNCIKSNRKCKRGIRLNFHDIQCERPPVLVPPTHDWRVSFQDDSRDIASEYKGGFERYHALEPEPKRRRLDQTRDVSYDYGQMAAPAMPHQQLPGPPTPYQNLNEHQSEYNSANTQGYMDHTSHLQGYTQQSQTIRQSDPDEAFYMQVFVEDVALWMDSMDADKHFSRQIPFQALREPMLKYAMLACAVRYLALVNPAYPEDLALAYYNRATQLLMSSLQNPDRDGSLCATAATILNIYEVMNEKALQRMNHIAGARALIKECRWDGSTTGIGGACFWLNVGLEVYSCLHFNWQVAWDPDTWGIDMTMSPQHIGGNEEEWNHKMLWIVAKCVNFSSTTPRLQDQNVRSEQMRLHSRHQQWLGLKQFCDTWDNCVPPTMRAVAYLPPGAGGSKSVFPKLWFIKRATVVARLFYHTAMVLLGNTNPMATVDPQTANTMQEMTQRHARQICGIVRHVKDRGVATGSVRCLAVAGEFLTDRREQEEVLQILDQVMKETGWRVAMINDDLKEKWGWNKPSGFGHSNLDAAQGFYQQQMAPVHQRARPPSGIINPVYKDADFSGPNAPYQGTYVPPAPPPNHHVLHTTQVYGFSGLTAI
ncbi:hypothetical protein DV738_g4689, partial [Chaetothyriales sp. CBS 135597]